MTRQRKNSISTVPIPTVTTELAWIEHIGQSPHDPVIWQGRLCAAVSKWRHLSYFEEITTAVAEIEPIVVDVETMGGRYNDPHAERMVGLPLAHYLHYLRQYIISASQQQQSQQHQPQEPQSYPVLYLAQNDIPSVLLPDIGPWPTVCTTRTTTTTTRVPPDLGDDTTTKSTTTTIENIIISEGKLYGTNWWMGPIGSGSPLHTDPLANALLQIVGRKDVALLNGQMHSSAMLYAGGGTTTTTSSRSSGPSPTNTKLPQGNTSPIDVFGCLPSGVVGDDDDTVPSSSTLMTEQRARYPEFMRHATVQTATLQPGDVLYIPPLCWHATRTTTTHDDDDDDNDFTVSVNAWWR